MRSRLTRPILALALTALVAVPSRANLPPDVDLYGKSLEAAVEAMRVYGPWDSPADLRRIADIGYRVVQASGFKDFPISFYLIDLAEPNAFALPGGHLFVTRGMMSLGLTDDELAALLGHEIAHVVHRHGVRMERRATLLNVLSQAAVLGVMLAGGGQQRPDPRLPYPLNVDYGQNSTDMVTGTYAAGLILGELLLRSYSRDFEDEADDDGQRWAAAAGFAQDGTEKLMAVLGSRLPDSKEYGYWRTHPFFEQRLAAARVRARGLSRGVESSTVEFRSWTQKQILDLGAQVAAEAKSKDAGNDRRRGPGDGGPGPDGRGPDGRGRGGLDEGDELRIAPVTAARMVEASALTAWPKGVEAERLRLDRLHREKEKTLSRLPISRDYGELIGLYDEQLDEVATLDPDSSLLDTLRVERADLRGQADAILPQAREVWTTGVYETGFLEIFLSNWPAAAERTAVEVKLGEAYSRTGRQADAVTMFLNAAASTDAELSKKALGALHAMAPSLDQLSGLAELEAQKLDPELATAAGERLDTVVKTYTDMASGANYLQRFPAGAHANEVTRRLYALADNMYGEVVLYQSLGDQLKAVERIQKILTHAPASPAAQKLLERVVLPS